MNTLLSPLIRAVPREGDPALLTLPGVLAALMADRIAAFPALRAHQRHAWHAFLAQLGAMALHASGLTEPPDNEAAWSKLLRALTPDDPDDHAWSLVTPPDCPALLQPPLPDGLAALKKDIATPDALDMLVTAKNHDIKQAAMAAAQPDDWLFALLTLQTMDGYSGAGNYGISRMNGGYANRAALGRVPPGGSGAQVQRDMRALLGLRTGIADRNLYPVTGGLALVWLAPWDGTASLPAARLDPLYIEICRRVRLIERNGVLSARTGSSKAERIVPPPGGVTGDPWAPLRVEKDGTLKALTLNARGFDYRHMVDLMFCTDGGRPAPLQEPAAGDPTRGMVLLARALVRGQGKTEGYYERRVPLSEKVRFLGPTDPAAAAASARVELAGEIQGRVLRPALLALLQNGPDKIDLSRDDPRTHPFLAAFDRIVDRDFFENLWTEMEHDEQAACDAARAGWVRGLLDKARTILDQADAAAPKATHRRWRARVRAQAELTRAAWGSKMLRPHLEQEKAHDDAA